MALEGIPEIVRKTTRRMGVRHSDTPEYQAWLQMKGRCYDPKNDSYRWYGAKGVAVCDQWLIGDANGSGFENFRSDVGSKPSVKHSLDRIDSTKPYEPGNVKWSTALAQTWNRSNTRFVEFEGKTVPLGELCKRFNTNYVTVYCRLFHKAMAGKWALEEALGLTNRVPWNGVRG
jgi:hypothetical protein